MDFKFTDRSLNVTQVDPFGLLVTPFINGSLSGVTIVDGVGSANLTPHVILAVLNPGDDIIAATRLMTRRADLMLSPGVFQPYRQIKETIVGGVNTTPLEHLYWIAVDLNAAVPANYTNNLYIVAAADTSQANWQNNMCHMTFNATDDVRKLDMQMSALAASYYAGVHVLGVGHV